LPTKQETKALINFDNVDLGAKYTQTLTLTNESPLQIPFVLDLKNLDEAFLCECESGVIEAYG